MRASAFPISYSLKEGLILLVIPARCFSTAEGLVKQESSAFKLLNAKTLDSCLTSPSAVEKRLAGMTSGGA